MIHGILNIYKEKGYTSHDVVAKLRGIIGQKKIGHTGTLDPDATGVLPVCLGKATKLCDSLTDKNKTYETILLLGKTTDTQDVSGTILSEKLLYDINCDMIEHCIKSFQGEYLQIPPMYSALKINGKKLYELAREGIEIERKARPVTIFHIDIKEIAFPRVRMEVTCSKGTYIRTLCHDIGQKLGCGGCMEQLIRTKVDRFEVTSSYTIQEVEKKVAEGKLKSILMSIDKMFDTYDAVTIKEEFVSFVYNGNVFFPKHMNEQIELQNEQRVRVYDTQGRFLAIYEYKADMRHFKVIKMFFDKNELS